MLDTKTTKNGYGGLMEKRVKREKMKQLFTRNAGEIGRGLEVSVSVCGFFSCTGFSMRCSYSHPIMQFE